MRSRLQYCASGYEAMAQLARGTGLRELGVMQMTEIIASTDIALAGPFPAKLQIAATYSAGLAVHSKCPERAWEFIRRLTGERHALVSAGFGESQVRGPNDAAHVGQIGKTGS